MARRRATSSDGWQLSVIPRQADMGASQRHLGDHVQQRHLVHKAFVKAKRALEVSLLNPVLETGQGLAGLELPTRHVRTGAASDTLQLLKTTTHEMRLADARRPVQEEVPLFTSELQSQLLDVSFTFTENLDSWQKVGYGSGALVENDAFLLLDWELAIEDANISPSPLVLSTRLGPLKVSQELGRCSVSRVA